MMDNFNSVAANDADAATHCEQALQMAAAAFQAERSADARITRYIVFDLEFSYDREVFKRYQCAEDDPTEGQLRWPFHRICAGAWAVLTIVPRTNLPIISNVTAVAGKSELEIATAFFALCGSMPDARVASWGGESKDLLVLRRVAMEHGVQLPIQMRDTAPFSRTRLDLCSVIRGLGHYIHLPELTEALGIASKPMPSRDIGVAVQYGQWAHVEQQVVADLYSTTLLLWRYLLAFGLASGLRSQGDEFIAQELARLFPINTWLQRRVTKMHHAA